MIYRVFKSVEPGVQIGEVAASTLKSIGDKISLSIDEKDMTFTITKTNKPFRIGDQFVTDLWVKELLS
jgi:hypothetical protein